MKDVSENELLSAYLDGELTAAEQAQVEQLLVTSPAARQLMEELRALSSTLQTMPQYKLGEDLSQQVLRIAERRMLCEPPAEAERLPTPAALWARSFVRRLLNPRAVAWSAVAVAVAVMFMLSEGGRDWGPGEREVAMRPSEETPESGGEAPSTAPGEQKDEKRGRPPAPGSESAPTLPKMPAMVQDEALGRKLTGGSGGSAEGLKRGSAAAASQALGPEVPEELIAKKVMPGRTVDEKPSARSTASKPSPGDQPPPGRPGPGAPRPAHRYVGKGADYYNGKHGGIDGAELANGAVQLAIEDVRGLQLGTFAQTTDTVWLVKCDISPAAVQKQLFDKTLEANGIRWEATQVAVADVADKLALARVTVERHSREYKQAVADPALKGMIYDMAYVEATPDQINSTLVALKSQPEAFSVGKIEPILTPQELDEDKDRAGGQVAAGFAVPAEDFTQKKEASGRRGALPHGRARWLRGPDNRPHPEFRAGDSGAGRTQAGEAIRRQPGPDTSALPTPKAPQPPAEPAPEPPGEAQPPAERAAEVQPSVERDAEGVRTVETPPPAVPEKGLTAPAGQPRVSLRDADEPAKPPAPATEPAPPAAPTEGPGEDQVESFYGQGVQRTRAAQQPAPQRITRDGQREETRKDHIGGRPPAVPERPATEGGREQGGQPAAGTGQALQQGAEPESGRRDEQRPGQRPGQRSEPERGQKHLPVSRVLFVLRLVEPQFGNAPPTAASMMETREAPAAEASPGAKR